MAEEPAGRGGVAQAVAVPRRRARISVVWVVPIVAAVVALGLAVQRVLSEGPTITIVFKAAEGIEAGKTVVKYKDVNIGQVTDVQLSKDYSRVEVTAKISKSAAGLMVEDASFWVVQPRVTLSGISGLGTLLSGNFIGFDVGKSTKRQKQFVGLEVAPIITYGQAGRQFVLKAGNLGSLGVGSPIYYRRLQAGQVVAYALAGDGRAVDVQVFINAPYDKFVTGGTRFWNASGIDVAVGASGVEVRTESLVALLAGGIAFDTPAFAEVGGPAAADASFPLYPDRATAMKQPESIAQRYVLYFNESLRGLAAGAPVTLLGLPVGEVTAVGLDVEPARGMLRGRVEIVTYPERLLPRLASSQAALGQELLRDQAQRRALFERLVGERKLRAQLRSGSLLTGQLYVALDFFPDAPAAKVDWNREVPVLPVVASTIPDLEAKLTSIIAKLDRLPYDAIGKDVTEALGALTGTLNDAGKMVTRLDAQVMPDLQQTLTELRRVLATADEVLRGGVPATLKQIDSTLEAIRGPLGTAERVLQNTDATLLGRNAPVQQELREALLEITQAARALRGLMEYLDRHPEALIRGKVEGAKP